MHKQEEVDDDHDPACKASVTRARFLQWEQRDNNEMITTLRVTCRTVPGVMLVWLDTVAVTLTTSRKSTNTVTTIALDYGYSEDKTSLGEQESEPSLILVTRYSST